MEKTTLHHIKIPKLDIQIPGIPKLDVQKRHIRPHQIAKKQPPPSLRHRANPRHMHPQRIHQTLFHLSLCRHLDHQPPAPHGGLERFGQPPQDQTNQGAGEQWHNWEGGGEYGHPKAPIVCTGEAIRKAWEAV